MIRRIRQYPPVPKTDDPHELRLYIERLVEELQEESVERIRDFEGFLFDSGTITTLTSTTSTIGTANVTSLVMGDGQVNTDVKARAYLSANQEDVNNTTWTKINLNAESYDIGGDFDHATNYKFTTPTAGYYLLTGCVQWVYDTTVADKVWKTAIYVDSASVAVTTMQTSVVQQVIVPVTTVEYIAAAKDIELYCYHNAGVDTPDVAGGSAFETFMAVHLLSV